MIESKNQEINLLNNITQDLAKNMQTNIELINRLEKFNLFDEEFYINNYDCENLTPIMHYVLKGNKYGNKPNKDFDPEFYSKFNKNVKNSGLNPFFYFVLYGIDEGLIRINNKIHQPRSINKLKLDPKINQFNELGITRELRNPKLIVSLTSFPQRMYDVHYCLYSLLTQQLKPDKLILWLAESQFPNKEKDIPQKVLSLKENGLEIRWCEDMGAYKKLLPSLKEYPDDIIVTADDD